MSVTEITLNSKIQYGRVELTATVTTDKAEYVTVSFRRKKPDELDEKYITMLSTTSKNPDTNHKIKCYDNLPAFDEIYTYQAVSGDSAASITVFVDEDGIILNSPANNENLLGDILKIKYNPKVSNLKTNIKESIYTTLGSQYPFIKRNGDAQYRTFTIGGLIYSGMDFVTGDSETPKVQTLSFPSDMSELEKEIIQEKKFRDAVLEFLQRDQVCLFRSATEGTMLIKLKDISLTPKEQLGRRIYEFSASTTEVGAIDTISLQKYKFKLYSK